VKEKKTCKKRRGDKCRKQAFREQECREKVGNEVKGAITQQTQNLDYKAMCMVKCLTKVCGKSCRINRASIRLKCQAAQGTLVQGEQSCRPRTTVPTQVEESRNVERGEDVEVEEPGLWYAHTSGQDDMCSNHKK
jgi:hypothetical protein